MSEKVIRITKSQRFEDIIALLTGEAVTHGTTVDEAVRVLEHERELLAKKNGSDSKKMTAEQVKNEGYKETILEYLGGLDEDSQGKTCTEILKAIPDFADFSNQKIAALMRQLKIAGRVKTVEVKGKTLFSLA